MWSPKPDNKLIDLHKHDETIREYKFYCLRNVIESLKIEEKQRWPKVTKSLHCIVTYYVRDFVLQKQEL